MRKLLFATALLLGSSISSGHAATDAGLNVPRLQSPAEETVEIGLSTETIAITSGFGGTELTIFGALDNADPLIQRQGRYDIVVVLQGPERNLVIRQKERFLGVWVNASSETFMGVPLSYLMATTRNLQDITDEKTLRQLNVGIRNFYLNPQYPGSQSPNISAFGNELRDIKTRQGLYHQSYGDVQFVSRTLFRATLTLPTNVPVGRHKARALLFRNGVFLREANAGLEIVKAGVEQSIHDAAHNYGFFYGIFAVALAVFTGWFGRMLFRKD